MITPGRAAPPRGLLLVLAVAALLAGLIGMHHLAVGPAPHGPAGAGAEPMAGAESMAGVESMAGAPAAPVRPAEPPTPQEGPHAPANPDEPVGGTGHAHGLLHLCLAVLAAGAVLVVVWLLLGVRSRPAARSPYRVVTPRTAPRAPPRGAPARLALLCVSRT